MAAPTSYTEKTLAEYMHTELGGIASALGWAVGGSDAGSYAEAVNSALLAYGVTDIASATNITKLRALARIEAWRKAVSGLALMIDFSADGGSYKRSQMQAQAKTALELSLSEGWAWVSDPNYVVTITRAVPVNDPYRYTDEENQTL